MLIACLVWCFFNSKMRSSFGKDRATRWKHLLKSTIKACLDPVIHIAIDNKKLQLSEVFQFLLQPALVVLTSYNTSEQQMNLMVISQLGKRTTVSESFSSS